jgi:hypothetical protein
MSALWAWFLSTKVGRWIVGIGVVLAALAAALAVAFVKGHQKGADEQATADKAKDAQSLADAAEQAVKATQARMEIEDENAKLPPAPPQKVADAASGTAAGKLRDDGWVE